MVRSLVRGLCGSLARSLVRSDDDAAPDPSAAIIALFSGGQLGGFYDPSDLSTMFQDAAGTVPVTADSDPVRLIRDKSGRNSHATAPSDAARPLYKTAGGLHWLEFDGIDDYLVTSAINFSAGTAMTAAAATTKKANAIQGAMSIGTGTSNRVVMSAQMATTPAPLRQAGYIHASTIAAPDPEVVATTKSVVAVGRSRIVVPHETSVWRNAEAVVTNTANQSTTLPTSVIYIGCNNTIAGFLNGSLYGAILRAAYSSDAEIGTIQDYLAVKIGGMPT